MVSYKEAIKNQNLNNYLKTPKGFEGLLRKRILKPKEKTILKQYLINPQGLTDNQLSKLTSINNEELKSYRETINIKLGTHVIIKKDGSTWCYNKHHNYGE